MKLNREQCIMLLDIINGSIIMSKYSGIPITQEAERNIDYIKEEIYNELRQVGAMGGN